MHVLYEKAASKATSAEPPPPMGNRNRTVELSTVPVRDHCPSGGRRHISIWLRVCAPSFVVSGRTCPLYGQAGLIFLNHPFSAYVTLDKLFSDVKIIPGGLHAYFALRFGGILGVTIFYFFSKMGIVSH